MTDVLLKHEGWSAFADGTLVHFAKLLMLNFFCSSIYMQNANSFAPFLRNWPNYEYVRSSHLQLILSLPRADQIFSVTKEKVDYVSELQKCEELLQNIEDLTDCINFILRTLVYNSATDLQLAAERTSEQPHQERIFLLKELCSQRYINAKRKIDRVIRSFEYQNKALNVRESVSVKRLAILASIFLPLSLASSLLSMQTRFVNFHLLLYDFFGVFVLIGSITILMHFIVRGLLSLKSQVGFSALFPHKQWEYAGEPKDVDRFKDMLISFTYFSLCVSFWLFFLGSLWLECLWKFYLAYLYSSREQ